MCLICVEENLNTPLSVSEKEGLCTDIQPLVAEEASARVGPVRAESVRNRGRNRGRTYDGNAPSIVDPAFLRVLAKHFSDAQDLSGGAVPMRKERKTCGHAPKEADVNFLCGFESDRVDSVDSIEAPREHAPWAEDTAAGVNSLFLFLIFLIACLHRSLYVFEEFNNLCDNMKSE